MTFYPAGIWYQKGLDDLGIPSGLDFITNPWLYTNKNMTLDEIFYNATYNLRKNMKISLLTDNLTGIILQVGENKVSTIKNSIC